MRKLTYLYNSFPQPILDAFNIKYGKILKIISNELITNVDLILYNNKKDIEKMQKSIHSFKLLNKVRLTKKDIYFICSYLNSSFYNFNKQKLSEKSPLNNICTKTIYSSQGTMGIINDISPFMNIILCSLCLITNNNIILRDSPNFTNTNKILVNILNTLLKKLNINNNYLQLLKYTDKNYFYDIKKLNGDIIFYGSIESYKSLGVNRDIEIIYIPEIDSFIYIDDKIYFDKLNNLFQLSYHKRYEILISNSLSFEENFTNYTVINKFSDLDSLINHVNTNKYMRTGYIFSDNKHTISKFKKYMDVKYLYINVSNECLESNFKNSIAEINNIPLYNSLIKYKYIVENV